MAIQWMMAFAAGRVTTQMLLADGIPTADPGVERVAGASPDNAYRPPRARQGAAAHRHTDRYVVRYATEGVRLPGESGDDIRIKRGEKVVLVLEAANRDPDVFPAPHSFRADRRPNPHVTFGFGTNRCPGASNIGGYASYRCLCA